MFQKLHEGTIRPLSRHRCRGQAMVETAIGLVVFVFVTAALVSFATLFLEDIDMIADARAETGAVARNADSGEKHGNGFGISSKAHPKIAEYGEQPISANYSDPYSYLCRLEEKSGRTVLATWRNNTVSPLITIPPTARHHTFDINLSLMGSDPLFPNGFDIDERIFMPPLGGNQR